MGWMAPAALVAVVCAVPATVAGLARLRRAVTALLPPGARADFPIVAVPAKDLSALRSFGFCSNPSI
jgi:hypothetical protein